MGANAQKLAELFIGAARKNPKNAPRILRKAASTFADLATDPFNAHIAKRLTAVGLDFAGAAMQQTQPEAAPRPPTTSDFTQLMRQTAEALHELGPDAVVASGAAIDATALTREVAKAEEPSKYISIQPLTFQNKDTTLGRSVTLKYGATSDDLKKGIFQSQTVAFWQGRKQEAQAMTIDFGTVLLPVPDPSAASLSARAYAIIEYGSDGNRTSVTVDIGLGRRITVVGNYISVIAGMDPPSTSSKPASTPGTIVVGASIGTFAAPSQAPVTRTVYFETQDVPNGGGLSTVKQVPLRATALLPPVPRGATAPTVYFSGFGAGDPTGTWIYTNLSNPALALPIVISPDSFFVQVSSATGGALSLPFELSL